MNDMIPIIDCSSGIKNCSDQIFRGLIDVGFVYLINHGVPAEEVR